MYNHVDIPKISGFIKAEPESKEMVNFEEEAEQPQCLKYNELLNNKHCSQGITKEKKQNHPKNIYSDKTSKVPITCDKCDRKFPRRGQFIAHFCQNHLKEAAEKFQQVCHQCGKVFRSRKHLMKHMWMHQGKQFKCNLCPAAFNQPSNLRRHLMVSFEILQFDFF